MARRLLRIQIVETQMLPLQIRIVRILLDKIQEAKMGKTRDKQITQRTAWKAGTRTQKIRPVQGRIPQKARQRVMSPILFSRGTP